MFMLHNRLDYVLGELFMTNIFQIIFLNTRFDDILSYYYMSIYCMQSVLHYA